MGKRSQRCGVSAECTEPMKPEGERVWRGASVGLEEQPGLLGYLGDGLSSGDQHERAPPIV